MSLDRGLCAFGAPNYLCLLMFILEYKAQGPRRKPCEELKKYTLLRMNRYTTVREVIISKKP